MFFLFYFFSVFSLFPKEVYYRFVDYSINYEILGKYQISKKQAESEFGYKFIYNDKGKLIFIDYIGKLNILKPSFFKTNQMRIDISDNKERRVFLNRGFQAKNDKDVYVEQLEYDEKGRIKSIFNYNKSNEIVKNKYGVAYYHFIYENDNIFNIYRFNESGFQIRDSNGVFFLKVIYNSKNLTKTVLYHDESKVEIKAKNGIYGFRLTYDFALNKIKEEYLDKNLKNLSNPFSVASKVYKYDAEGKVTEILNYDINNNLISDENDVAVYRYKYNLKEKDYYIKEYTYNEKNILSVSQYGYAIKKVVFYPQSNEKRVINYSNKINKNYNEDIFTSYEEKYEIMDNFKGIAVYSYIYDSKFNIIETRFFNKKFNLMNDFNGVMIYKYSHNNEGLIISEEHYGDFNKPIEDIARVFKYKFDYDLNGNLISKRNYSKNNNLVGDLNFVFEYVYEYDKQNRIISQENYGNFGQIQDDIYGVSVYKYEYNKFGKLEKQTNYGPDLKIRSDVGGFAIYKWIYDSKGDLVNFQKFDSNGDLI